jgi:EAL and modified HD-GYP domain-containing signal transduction protein
MPDIFLGRQPIFDRELNCIGYELLYRSGSDNWADFPDDDRATAQVFSNIFSEIGLEHVVGSRKAFINVPDNFIHGKYTLPIQQGQIVLEILETTLIDAELVASLEHLIALGYQIALDDVTNPESVRLILPQAHIVKIDLRSVDQTRLKGMIDFLKSYRVLLLAEKVETQEEFTLCKQLGFDLFQGYFLSKPHIIQRRQIAPSRLVILQLIAEIQNPQVSYQALNNIVLQDVSLGYKILRLINSAYYGLPEKVNSLHQAMTLLGLKQLQMWLTIFLLSETGDKPHELTVTALIRAKMCELLARQSYHSTPAAAFTVGLISILDALLDLSLEEVLNLLPLSDEIVDALLHGNGPLGKILAATLAYEKAEWEKVEALGFSSKISYEAYMNALQWTTKIDAINN